MSEDYSTCNGKIGLDIPENETRFFKTVLCLGIVQILGFAPLLSTDEPFLRDGSLSRHSANLGICSLLLTDEPLIYRMRRKSVHCSLCNASDFGRMEGSIIIIINYFIIIIIGHIAKTKTHCNVQ